eukprot:scaffold15168_cov118-Skeletonema_dohrnii-CCMP3373.AAC.1
MWKWKLSTFIENLSRHRSVRSSEEFGKADAENGGALSAEIRGMTQDCLRVLVIVNMIQKRSEWNAITIFELEVILYKIRTVRRFQVPWLPLAIPSIITT